MKITKKNQIDYIMAYESGELNDTEIIKLFAHLIKTKLAFSLQGSYGRSAVALIEQGLIDTSGNIIKGVD